MIIAEEISSPIKYNSYDVPSIILNYSVFALEAIIAAQSSLHCYFSITWFHWNAIELCNYCTKVNRVIPPLQQPRQQKNQPLKLFLIWLPMAQQRRAHISGTIKRQEYRTRQFIGEKLILAIGNFSVNSPILKSPILITTPTKPLLKMKKLEKKDVVAQIANIISANCFSQTNSPNITLVNKYSCTVSQRSRYQ